jgi:hypothetical protein
MDDKRRELRLECLKLAFLTCREYTEALERAKGFEDHILREDEVQVKPKAKPKKNDNLGSPA